LTIAPACRPAHTWGRRIAVVALSALVVPLGINLGPAHGVDLDVIPLPLPLPGTDPLPGPTPIDNPAPVPVPVPVPGPETTIVSGPTGWVMTKKATFDYESDLPGSSFECSLDGLTTVCDGTTASFTGFASGTHQFSVAARDMLGNVDATPATRSFTLPRNNKALAHSKGWKKAKGTGHFMRSYSVTSKKGAKLTTRASSVKQIALVISKGKGFGVVKVYFGKQLLKKVNLASSTAKKRKAVSIANFSSPRSGTVKVVVASAKKKVVVEGLGIATG
jgi:hypothetical protein